MCLVKVSGVCVVKVSGVCVVKVSGVCVVKVSCVCVVKVSCVCVVKEFRVLSEGVGCVYGIQGVWCVRVCGRGDWCVRVCGRGDCFCSVGVGGGYVRRYKPTPPKASKCHWKILPPFVFWSVP